MPYASVNVFSVRAGTMASFVALQQEAFLPLLRRQPGFLALEIVQTGTDAGVATLWWASEEARRVGEHAAGARQAVQTRGRSLLPIGVLRVTGAFTKGDVVDPHGVFT